MQTEQRIDQDDEVQGYDWPQSANVGKGQSASGTVSAGTVGIDPGAAAIVYNALLTFAALGGLGIK